MTTLSDKQLTKALLHYKETRTIEARNKAIELIMPLAKSAVKTYPCKIRSDLAQSCLEEMLKPYRLLSFDQDKGKAIHFVRRCLRNLAINHYNKLQRETKLDVFFSSFGPKNITSDMGEKGNIPDSDKAVLKAEDNVQLGDTPLQGVVSCCVDFAKRRFSARPLELNLFIIVLKECLRYGVSFDSLELIKYISKKYDIPKQKVRYICKSVRVMFKFSALNLGVVREDKVSIDGKSLVDTLNDFYPNNLFSELAVLLGPDVCAKLVSVFGGSTLRVPTAAELHKSIIERTIYLELLPIKTKAERKEKAQELANRFDMSRKSVMAKYRALKSKFIKASALV